MARGDQYHCDWCNFSWRTKSDLLPIRCPSCEHNHIINEADSFRKILGKKNILDVDKKNTNKGQEVVEKVIEEKSSVVDKLFRFFRK